jgi:hypothetical protein
VFTTGDLDYSHYGECYGSKAGWIGGWPRTGRLVRTSVGSVTTGIDIGMGDSGHVTGTVGPASATGSRLAVRLYRADHRNLSVPAPAASVAADGSYTYYPAIAGDFVVCVSSTTRDEVGIEPTCGGNVPWDGPGSPAPEAATSVHVAEGGTATAPPITVRGGAAITGRVRHAKGVQGSGDYTQVDLYRNGYEIGTPRTANPGFRFNNLRPGRYLVCAHDYDQSNPTNPYSDGRCWRHVVWTGGPPPATATPVVAVRGQTTNGTFITLPSWPRPDGSIAGHILGIGAKYRTSFLVEAFDSRGRSIRESTVRANGSYRITGLPPTRRGYTVCAGLFNDAKALPDLADTCWRSVAYGDRYGPPRSAAAVAVASDKTHGGIDIRMRRGGAIAGRVTYHGKPVASQVVLLAPGRRVIARTHTRNAHYAFHNLSPSRKGYYICFDPDDARGFPRAARTGFNTQCYDRKPR